MPLDDLKKKVEDAKAEMKTLEETFESEVKKLQASYEQMQKDKDETIVNVKKSPLASCRLWRQPRRRSCRIPVGLSIGPCDGWGIFPPAPVFCCQLTGELQRLHLTHGRVSWDD